MVSFSHPHDPFAISRKWWDLYRDEDIPMPSHGYDEASLHPHERRLRAVCAMNGMEITEDHIRAARRAYYGAISYVDDHISRLIGVLRDTAASTARSSSSPATTARCSASAVPGTR